MSDAIRQNTLSLALIRAGEPLAAGFMELPDAAPIRRVARALRRHFEASALPEWAGVPLYPSGATTFPCAPGVVQFSYWAGLTINSTALAEKQRGLRDGAAEALAQAAADAGRLYRVGSSIPPKYSLGGGGYTHSIINFGRVLREGLQGYASRLERHAGAAREPAQAEFYDALGDALAGLRALHRRTCDTIARAIHDRAEGSTTGARLLAALEHAPLKPARTFYEALVATNWLWYR